MIIYIHGFGGSGNGSKAKLFREYFKSNNKNFIAPSLSYVPNLAISTLKELIESYNEDVYLIGSSLGGYYSIYLTTVLSDIVKKTILINPAVNPIATLNRAIGKSENFYDNSYYEWNQNHLKMLEEYKKTDLKNYKDKFMLLFQKGMNF